MNAAGDNSSQYILITPQGKSNKGSPYMILTFFYLDASNLVPGPYVTIHRLADPERR